MRAELRTANIGLALGWGEWGTRKRDGVGNAGRCAECKGTEEGMLARSASVYRLRQAEPRRELQDDVVRQRVAPLCFTSRAAKYCWPLLSPLARGSASSPLHGIALGQGLASPSSCRVALSTAPRLLA